MNSPNLEFTPIRARTSNRVHTTTLQSAKKTACGKKASGWIVSLLAVNCQQCKLAMVHDARARMKRRRAARVR